MPQEYRKQGNGWSYFENEFPLASIDAVRKYVQVCIALLDFISILCICNYANKNHKQSRLLFINEAKKFYQKEFT